MKVSKQLRASLSRHIAIPFKFEE